MSKGTIKSHILALCNAGQSEAILRILDTLDVRDSSFLCDIYFSLLCTCTTKKLLREGRQIHAHIVKTGYHSSILLVNVLINMYAKCESMSEASLAFDQADRRDVYTWTTMITGYVQTGDGFEAIKLYKQMHGSPSKPNKVTYLSVLSGCASSEALQWGKYIHCCILKEGLETHLTVGNALVSMYSKCGSFDTALHVFKWKPYQDVVSWNTLISGYALSGDVSSVFRLILQMQEECFEPNRVTYVSLLCACINVGVLEWSKYVHAYLLNARLESDIVVGNALLSMYNKCGNIKDAHYLFCTMNLVNEASWNTIISAYLKIQEDHESVKLFWQMQGQGFTPNKITYCSVLTACAGMGALLCGKHIHTHLITASFGSDAYLASNVVCMYAKCGSIRDARKIFDRMRTWNMVLWTAMISGYAEHGDAYEAIKLFEHMQLHGLKPNYVTYVSVLTACSHAGLVDSARHYFQVICRVHALGPTVEHYVCMIDLLGHVGHLQEAKDVILRMPKPDIVVWRAFLAACKFNGDVQLAESVLADILRFKSQDSAAFVMLSNIYANEYEVT